MDFWHLRDVKADESFGIRGNCEASLVFVSFRITFFICAYGWSKIAYVRFHMFEVIDK